MILPTVVFNSFTKQFLVIVLLFFSWPAMVLLRLSSMSIRRARIWGEVRGWNCKSLESEEATCPPATGLKPRERGPRMQEMPIQATQCVALSYQTLGRGSALLEYSEVGWVFFLRLRDMLTVWYRIQPETATMRTSLPRTINGPGAVGATPRNWNLSDTLPFKLNNGTHTNLSPCKAKSNTLEPFEPFHAGTAPKPS